VRRGPFSYGETPHYHRHGISVGPRASRAVRGRRKRRPARRENGPLDHFLIPARPHVKVGHCQVFIPGPRYFVRRGPFSFREAYTGTFLTCLAVQTSPITTNMEIF